MKSILRILVVLLCCLPFLSQAQNPNRITIKGVARDTMGAESAFATVMLLNPSDSTLVNFTRTDDKGSFSFKNVKNSGYILKVSYVGYIPVQMLLQPAATEVQDLGLIELKPISKELMEVVIRTAKAPLSIRGDTIEYDASTFKVPPGSTVEDLLRRLPGIDVDADGNIKAQGKDVKRVYVDGKTFFGDDPKSATKNLGAETISKVQVYNEKSEQAKLTGVDDGKKEKALNLELKDEYKKGSFGKITGAVGTDDRWASRASYNRFNAKQQVSFLGYGNNINQTGVNWEDYGEFKGQNTFNQFDNGDFGFSNGGGRYIIFGGDDGPLSYFDGRGFTRNFGAGANYNYDQKKTKGNLSYFYNETRLNFDQYTFRQNFLDENTFFNSDTTTKRDFRGNHNISGRLEQNIDSNDVVIAKASVRLGNNNTRDNQTQRFDDGNGSTRNQLTINNNNGLETWRLTSAVIYRHKFKKKGRSLALSGGFNDLQTDGSDQLFSLNEFFDATTFTEQVRQLNQNANNNREYKSSALFTEPLTKKWFWETFYNFSNAENKVDRQVFNPVLNNERIDNLSVFYDNKVLYNRLGSVLRYNFEGLNLSAGVAGQQIRLEGAYAIDANTPLGNPITKTFNNVTPNVDLGYEFANGLNLNGNYSYSVKAPGINDLQPVPNVNNPAFRVEGNPNLEAEKSQEFSVNVGYWNPSNFANFNLGSEMSLYDNQIVYSQIVELIDTIGYRTTTRPDNLSGGRQFNTYLWSNYPIIKTKLTLSLSGNINFSKTPAYVNGVLNQTNNTGYSARLGISLTPNQKLILGVNGRLSFNEIRYSIQEQQNQNIQNHSVDGSVKWQFASKFFLESNLNYAVFRNDRFDFNRDVPIWNASVRRILGKTNRVEVRLAAFDIFNKNVYIRQFANQNFVTRNVAATLARYYMLSVSYNVRGYENKLKKNDWW
jgi:outer membrane receptor protein involved in Fe transport